MKLKNIQLNLIRIPEVRVTAVYDEETAKLLKESLAAAGTINPVVVVSTEDGFILVDGLHRFEEARDRGDSTLPAVIYEGDTKDALLMNLILNKVRGKTKASEMVKVIGSLYQDYGIDIEKIQEKTGLSRDYIEKLIKVSTASPLVQEALDEEIIGIGHAFEIARLPYAVQQEEIIAKHQVWRFKVKELHDQITAVLEEMELIKTQPPSGPDEVSRRPVIYHCEGCKDEVEPRYLRPVMLCPNCFGEVWRLAKASGSGEVKNLEDGGGD